jgi:outer membrane murein-binding lipoprotein Lpp
MRATGGIGFGGIMSETNEILVAPALKDKWYRKRWVIGVAAFFLGALVMSGGSASQSASTAAPDTTSQVSQLKTDLDTANAQIAALSAAAAAPAAPAVSEVPAASVAPSTFSDGTYLVGTDLPVGRYKGATTGGNGYWQIATDANGSTILSNNNVTGPFYIQVKKGQYLELSGVEIHKVK